MIKHSLSSLPDDDSSLTLIKFLLPLANDVLALPATLGFIDTLCHLGAFAHEVVAVDDASGDSTAAEARRFAHVMPLWLIQHSRPLGRGRAFRTAVEAACGDAADDDLLVPIDPRRRPDCQAALQSIALARAGREAVVSPSGRESWRSRVDHIPSQVTVYRAGLIKRHLAGFLAAVPAGEENVERQLERYLIGVGVRFYRAAAAGARPPILSAIPGNPATAAPAVSRSR